MNKKLLTLICILLIPIISNAKIRNDYELTVNVSIKASHGWNLYIKKIFDGEHNGGYYTNPDSKTRVKDFWSNGEYAKFDRDNNGHHETIFIIENRELVYIGSIGSKGKFIHVSNKYKRLLNKSVIKFTSLF